MNVNRIPLMLSVIPLFIWSMSASLLMAQESLSWLSDFNIVWTSPGEKAIHSMPIGGGNISLNVWTTKNDLLFYIGSPDSWVDGNVPGKVHNVKLGRIRLNFSPNPFAGSIRQELDLATNSIQVSARAKNGTSINLRIWVDAFNPIVHIEGNANSPVDVTANLETWRGEARFDENVVMWNYRNEEPSVARSTSISKQRIHAISSVVPDPIKHLTFGGRLRGVGMIPDGENSGIHEGRDFQGWKIKSTRPQRQFYIQTTLRIEQDLSLDIWEKALTNLEEETHKRTKQDWEKTKDWWNDFWNRSHIVINPGASIDDPAWLAGRNYQLFRAMLAANRRGRFMNLFNGAAFVAESDPDRRQWDHAGFTAQNQRLSYWPLLKTGDFDVMEVGLNFYVSRLELEKAWARHFWGVKGAVYPESMDVFGMPVRMARKDGTATPDVLRRHWTSGMEFALMMLEKGRYTGEDIQEYLPVPDAIIRFYDSYYRKLGKDSTGSELDEQGRLAIYPANALENYPEALNPACALSGLIALSEAMIALPGDVITEDERNYYLGFREKLPEIPVRMISKDTPPDRGYLPFYQVISPAEKWTRERWDNNMELPQLYPVWPFRLYGVGRPDLELARNTWQYGYTDEMRQKSYFGWFQGGILTACLGLTVESREYLLAKLLHPHWPDPGGREMAMKRGEISLWPLNWLDPAWEIPRYPAFYDDMKFNQRPDMDHGSSGMIQLQEMLMQTVDDRILLLPAWPKEWDVDFKLHAPLKTIVEASIRGGRIVNLEVTPESRRKDVEVLNGF